MMAHETRHGAFRQGRTPGIGSLRAAGLLLALALAGCSSTGDKDGEPTKGPWVQASPVLQDSIDDSAERLPWTHNVERLELIRWFASVGEPAYPKLLELALDMRPDVAAAALASLGATRDKRLVPYIRDLNWPTGTRGRDLQLERARTLVRLGDWSSIPVLIKGLRDERLYTRVLCSQALYEATNERHGFDPQGDDEGRDASVRRWETWWASRQQEGLLGTANP